MSSVLIVDDEPNIRRMVGALLASEGYEVRDAADGQTGVARAAETSPDVVLLDLMMPGELDGLGTLERLREAAPDVPVIMMSGKAGLSDAVKATKLGAFNLVDHGLALRPRLSISCRRIEIARAADDERQWHVLRSDAVGFLALLSEWQSDFGILEPDLIQIEDFRIPISGLLEIRASVGNVVHQRDFERGLTGRLRLSAGSVKCGRRECERFDKFSTADLALFELVELCCDETLHSGSPLLK
jgi:CheY-like chemotaxis protein